MAAYSNHEKQEGRSVQFVCVPLPISGGETVPAFISGSRRTRNTQVASTVFQQDTVQSSSKNFTVQKMHGSSVQKRSRTILKSQGIENQVIQIRCHHFFFPQSLFYWLFQNPGCLFTRRDICALLPQFRNESQWYPGMQSLPGSLLYGTAGCFWRTLAGTREIHLPWVRFFNIPL